MVCKLLNILFVQETAPSVINWQDYEGRTALHLAVADGNDAVANALVGELIFKPAWCYESITFV